MNRSEKARRAADYRHFRQDTDRPWSLEDEAVYYAGWEDAWARHEGISEAAIRTIDDLNREIDRLRDMAGLVPLRKTA